MCGLRQYLPEIMTKNAPNPRDLLAWYQENARTLPWRRPPGSARKSDPYAIWLSEVMLQQTTVAAVIPYFVDFIETWPTVAALAAAELDAVLTKWAGLGYYARARNLHKCAQVVAQNHRGRFPETEADLLDLPGIGPYTAAAIAAIAFDSPATPADGNVERVMARLYGITTPLPAAKVELKSLAQDLTARLPAGGSPGDYAQAVMDLGATICSPRSPNCPLCPWGDVCIAEKSSQADRLPRRSPKKARPTRRGYAYWITQPNGAVLLRRRPEKGLLGGMMEVPTSDWNTGEMVPPKGQAPMTAAWRQLPGRVRHTFTHFHLELTVLAAHTEKSAEIKVTDKWIHPDGFGAQALPSVMQKVIRHALKHTAGVSV